MWRSMATNNMPVKTREPPTPGKAKLIDRSRQWAESVAQTTVQALRGTGRAVAVHQHWTNAAALAFFFLLSLLPLLFLLAAIVTYLPVPDLFPHVLAFLGQLVPNDAMKLVRGALTEVLAGHERLISLGILSSIWAASAGFNALIGALNTAYSVGEQRPFWRRQLVALALTLVAGVMAGGAILSAVLGGRFGWWLAAVLGLDPVFALLWPAIRWIAVLLFTVVSVEVIYFLAPNRRQEFVSQSPGAVLAVAIWIAGSYALQLYLHSFAQANWIYGTLRAVIALMLWLYVSSWAILLGAELNAQLEKVRENLRPTRSNKMSPIFRNDADCGQRRA
jgi:membrane protein